MMVNKIEIRDARATRSQKADWKLGVSTIALTLALSLTGVPALAQSAGGSGGPGANGAGNGGDGGSVSGQSGNTGGGTTGAGGTGGTGGVNGGGTAVVRMADPGQDAKTAAGGGGGGGAGGAGAAVTTGTATLTTLSGGTGGNGGAGGSQGGGGGGGGAGGAGLIVSSGNVTVNSATGGLGGNGGTGNAGGAGGNGGAGGAGVVVSSGNVSIGVASGNSGGAAGTAVGGGAAGVAGAGGVGAILNGGTTYLGAVSGQNGADAVQVNGAATLQLGSNLTGNITVGGKLTFDQSGLFAGTSMAQVGNAVTISGQIVDSSTAAGALVVTASNAANQNPSAVTLTGVNMYSGGTTVSGGTLVVGNNNALGIPTGSTKVTGGTLDVAGFTIGQGDVSVSGGTLESSTAGGTIYASSSFSLSGTGTLQNLNVSGAARTIVATGGTINTLSGTTGLTVGVVGGSSNGAVLLQGTNTYIGDTVVWGGTLQGSTTSSNSFSANSALYINTTVNSLRNGSPAVVDLGKQSNIINNVYLNGGVFQNGALASGTIISTGGVIDAITASSSTLWVQGGNTTLKDQTTLGALNVDIPQPPSSTSTGGQVEIAGGAMAAVNGATSIGSTGSLLVDANANLTLGSVTNGGNITNNGTQLTVNDSFTNNGIVTNNTVLTAKGGLTNYGTVKNYGAFNDDLTNYGTVINNGGYAAANTTNSGPSATITNNQTWTGNLTNTNGGAVTNAATGTWNGTFSNGTGATDTASLNNYGTWNIQGKPASNYGFLINGGQIIGGPTTGALVNYSTGTVVAQAGSSIGSIDNKGTFIQTGASSIVDAKTNVYGNFNNDGGVANLGGYLLTVGTLTLTSGSIDNGSVKLNNGGTVSLLAGSISAAILDSGTANPTNLVKTGTGTVILSGANTYKGSTSVSGGGALALGGTSALGDQGNSVVVNDTSTLDLGGQTIVQNGGLTVTGTSSTAQAVVKAGAFSSTGAFNLTDALITANLVGAYGGAANQLVVSSLASDANGSTTKLSGTNTYSGPTLVQKGAILEVGAGGAIGTMNASAGTITVAQGATLKVDNDGLVYLASASTLANSGTVNNLGVTDGQVTNSGSATTITNQETGTWIGALTNSNGASVLNKGSWNGALSNQSGTITNTGVWTDTSVNGSTNSANGTLFNYGSWYGNLTNAGSFNNFNMLTGSLTNNGETENNGGKINGSVVNKGTFVENANGMAVGAVTGSFMNSGTFNANAALSVGAFTNTNNGATTIAPGAVVTASSVTLVNGTISGTGTISTPGLITLEQGTVSANLTGIGQVAKTTTGKVVLSGADTYSGVTAIQGGTLEVSGMLGSSAFPVGAITIDQSATLQVDGTGSVNAGNIDNAGIINVASGGQVTDYLVNSGTVNNSGTYNADVLNVGSGVINTTGTWNGSISNGLSAQVNASGVINGNVVNDGQFTVTGALASNGTVNNSGAYAFQGNTVNGVSLFTNNGTVTSTSGVLKDTSSISGTAFDNKGLIDLTAGGVTTNTLTIVGNYTGETPSAVKVIASNATSKADELVVQGSTSGVINLAVVPASGVAITAGKFIPVLDVTQSQTATFGSVVIENASGGPGPTSSFATYSVVADPNTKGLYDLYAAPNLGVVSGISGGIAAGVSAMATGFFQGSLAYGVSSPSKDPNVAVFGIWTRDGAGANFTNVPTTESSAGLPTGSGNLSTYTHFSGEQVGADAALQNVGGTGWTIHTGITGGEIQASSSSTDGSENGRDSTSFNVPFLGLYTVVTGHGFSGQLIYRHDFWEGQATSTAAGITDSPMYGSGNSVTTEAEYHISLPNNIQIVPNASFTAYQADFSSLTLGTNGTLRVGPVRDDLASVGLQSSYAIPVGNWVLQPSASASLWSNFGGNVPTTYTTATSSVPYYISTAQPTNFGQIGVALTAQPQQLPNLILNLKADVRAGEGLRGGSLNLAGVYRF